MKKNSGFTLIELLATLVIIATIAALLFPFIQTYITMANQITNIRSMSLMQDAMDRYRAVNDSFNGWGGTSGTSGTGEFINYALLSPDEVSQIITDITAPGINRTLQTPVDNITNLNIIIVRTAPAAGPSVRRWSPTPCHTPVSSARATPACSCSTAPCRATTCSCLANAGTGAPLPAPALPPT